MSLEVIKTTQVRNNSGSDCGVSRTGKETCRILDLLEGRGGKIYQWKEF